MGAYRYRVVDVFTMTPLEGNPLAVFPDATGIDESTMQKIAKELNLAETAFVVPATRSDCAAGVRIFTPNKEMLFAGHPTLGTSFVLVDEQLVAPRAEHFSLEEKLGPVSVRVEAKSRPMFWLTTPPISEGRLYDRRLCAESLGLELADLLDVPPQFLDAGNPTVIVAAKDKQAVDKAWIDMRGVQRLKDGETVTICVFIFCPTAEGAYSRMFAPEYGIPEDPATGSSTGPLAYFMMKHGLINSGSTGFVSEQGTKMKRRSLIHVNIASKNCGPCIEVGGFVTPLIDATLNLGQEHDVHSGVRL